VQPTYDADSKRSINYTYRRKLAATIHIHRRHLVLLLSPYADLILPSHGEMEDWVDLDMHSSNDAQPVLKAVYHMTVVKKNTTVRGMIRTRVLSQRSRMR